MSETKPDENVSAVYNVVQQLHSPHQLQTVSITQAMASSADKVTLKPSLRSFSKVGRPCDKEMMKFVEEMAIKIDELTKP